MRVAKIAISIDTALLNRLDFFVKKHLFKTRSEAITCSVREVIEKLERNRLAQECAKLDIAFEQKMADEGLNEIIS